MTTESLVDWLKEQNIAKVSEQTGIPKSRMYKWTKGQGLPKIDDYNTLLEYYNRTNGTNSTKEEDVVYDPKKKQSSLSVLHSKLLKLLLLDDDFDEELRREAREPLKKLDELIKKNEEMKKNG